MAQDNTKVHQYEAMFLLGPVAQAEPETAMNLCRKVIENHGGQIILIKKWDERKLSYEIEGQKRGTFIISYFRAPSSAITPMERDVNLSEEILRAMFTKADHLNETEMNAVEPQPVQPERPPGERFGGFGGGFGGEGGDRGRDRGGDRGGDRPDRAPRGRREEGAPEAGANKD